MKFATLTMLAGRHAASARASIGLVMGVMLIGAMPMLVGLNAAGLIARAVESQTDEINIRRVVIEPRGLHDSHMFDERTPINVHNIAWWSPLLEIGARVNAGRTEAVSANDEASSAPRGVFVTIEGFSRGDPRFAPDRVRLQSSLSAALSAGTDPVAIMTRGLAHDLGSAESVEILVQRTVGGESERLTLEIPVLGVTNCDTRRLFLCARMVQALDNWTAGADYSPEFAEPSSARASLFAARVKDVETVVENFESAGWRVQHRLRDVKSLQRTRGLIYTVSALACSGFFLAGFIAAAVYVASTRRQSRVNAAVMKLCGVTPLASAMILVAPLALAAFMGFLASVTLASLASGRLYIWIAPMLDIELPLHAPGIDFGLILLAGSTTMLPLVSGLAWSFQRCWRASIRDSLGSPGQC